VSINYLDLRQWYRICQISLIINLIRLEIYNGHVNQQICKNYNVIILWLVLYATYSLAMRVAGVFDVLCEQFVKEACNNVCYEGELS